jgi:hypothetical protein
VADEQGTGPYLVGEGQPECQIDVQVDRPPRLITQAPARGARRQRTGKHQEAEGDDSGEHVGIGTKKSRRL